MGFFVIIKLISERIFTMEANYKNWVPKSMVTALGIGTTVLALGTLGISVLKKENTLGKRALQIALGAGTLVCGSYDLWAVNARKNFSYNGKRQLSRQIVEGTADYVTLPDGGLGLDVGCGSGALTIAVAKNNPHAKIIGIDRWGGVYSSYSKELCEQNAAAEGVSNVTFATGNAVKLDFPDEIFDAVTSNYVYHNIMGKDKQKLILETLRVLKKGGTFAIHDIMASYGDVNALVECLKEQGYEEVHLIDTTDGMFMTKFEAKTLMLEQSFLLYGKK